MNTRIHLDQSVHVKKGSHHYPQKSIAETIVNGFFTINNSWTVTCLNQAAEKLLQRTQDIVGKNLKDELQGIIPVWFYSACENAFSHGGLFCCKEYWPQKASWFDVIAYHSGDTLYVSFKSCKPAMDKGRLVRGGGQELQVINELYRYATKMTNVCLWEWNLRTKELFWIDGGHKMVFGYEVDHALIPVVFWEDCLHPDDKVRVRGRLYELITRGNEHAWEDEYRFKKANNDYACVHDRAHIIFDEDNRPSRMIGITQDITARKAAESQLLEIEKGLVKQGLARRKEITEAVLTAQEHERADIGKELHDNLNQVLAAATMYIKLASKPGQQQDIYLETASGLVNNVIGEIRKISKRLETTGIHLIGLYDSTRILLDDLHLAYGIDIELRKNNVIEEDLSKKLQLDLFRIIQEQLNNVIKHANATRVAIHLNRRENHVILLIADNGNGYDLTTEKKGGTGIININGRVELYNGKVTLSSSPGKGYELMIELPINDGISAG